MVKVDCAIAVSHSDSTPSPSSSSHAITNSGSHSKRIWSTSQNRFLEKTVSSDRVTPLHAHRDKRVCVITDKATLPDDRIKYPSCWTECPNCPPSIAQKRRYHLIDVRKDSAEWNVVACPLNEARFEVTSVRRIQNEMIWQRLCFEKQLMLRERADVNERFLYHTSRSVTSVICEEGLDQRLSRSTGQFGSGIYFRYI